jgi:hypothetical protein
MILIIPELLAAVPTSAGCCMFQVVVFLERTCRREAPIANIASKGTIS